jgi:hypothetical protein
MSIINTANHQIRIEEESEYGTDPASSPKDIEVIQGSLTPVSPEYNSMPQRYGAYLTEKNFTGKLLKNIAFSVPLNQADTNDTAYALTYLLKACGLTPNTTANYFNAVCNPAQTSLSINAYHGGKRDILKGTRGDATIILNAGELAVVHFEFMGLYNQGTDTAIPGSPSYTGCNEYVFNDTTITYNTVNYHISHVELALNNVLTAIGSGSTSDSGLGIYQIMITDSHPTVTFDLLVEDTNVATIEAAIEAGTEATLLHERNAAGEGDAKNPVISAGTIITNYSVTDESGAMRYECEADVTSLAIDLEKAA